MNHQLRSIGRNYGLAFAMCGALSAACSGTEPGQTSGTVPAVDMRLECVPQSVSADNACGGSGGPGSGSTGVPDLIPQSTLGTYCIENFSGQLVVTIANVGNGTAGASTTRVAWSCTPGGTVDLATPPLPPGAMQSFFVSRPSTCLTPYPSFTISADVRNVVSESNEANNSASATCNTWKSLP